MDDKQKTIERWLIKASHDLETAKTMIGCRSPQADVVCFHCQQCAEKCLKAFLVSVNQDFPKTHDLAHLLNLCTKHNESFDELQECALALTDYAVETRYVDDWREISLEEARDAIKFAITIWEFVIRILKTP